jgi:hypothetical protein
MVVIASEDREFSRKAGGKIEKAGTPQPSLLCSSPSSAIYISKHLMTVNLACTHCDVITDLSDIHKVIS